jgi:hypothetical protein
MAASFDVPRQTDVYRPLTDYNAPHVRRYSAVARLAACQMYQGELDARDRRVSGGSTVFTLWRHRVNVRVLSPGVESARGDSGVTAVGTNTNFPFARLDVAADRSHAGRFFERTDDRQAPAAAIVRQRAAQRLWGGDPLGRRLRVTWNQQGVGGGGGCETWLTVVGLVEAVRVGGMDDATGIDVYAAQSGIRGRLLLHPQDRDRSRVAVAQVRSALDGGDDCGGSLGGVLHRVRR